MKVTKERVAAEYDWVRNRSEVVVPLINSIRDELGEAFGTDVATVTDSQYLQEVSTVFEDGDVAVNITGLIMVLRDVDVESDYPGFVVDEVLGRDLAGMIAGGQPLQLLAEATFHYADIHTHYAEASAGVDDLDAALAAGFQTRLPGWSWTEQQNPFSLR